MSNSLFNGIHYFRIPVVDLRESVSWYSDCLKFKLRFKRDGLAVYELETGPLLVLVEADKNSRGHFLKGGQAEFSVGFTTTNINELYEYLVSQDVKVESIQEDEGHQFFHFYDPNGNKLQVHN
ncbi:VOC family protein [Paenisporosarcina quisquiliarum]|uniref:VOC family protein n=1 Tax=Paenisporosarcina quisquiliarum TaxID=365346 RepID=A0A9X3RE07_9BACL|nr:VOC family protein [Paenisporosarcina quisquiliarum]MCZ8537704.1 VOC family protein [Paenisporosarcina quisquiliarum]